MLQKSLRICFGIFLSGQKNLLFFGFFIFGPLFTKYQHFLAEIAHISEMRAEIEKVTVA